MIRHVMVLEMVRRKKENLAAFHRKTILETANALFLKKGIAGGTMDEISREAGYSKSTVYAYFKNKEDILNHLIHEGMCYLLKQIEEVDKKSSRFDDFFMNSCWAIAKIRDDFPVYFEGITGRINLGTDHSEQISSEDQPILQQIYNTGEEVNAIVQSRIQRGEDNGELPHRNDWSETILMVWLLMIGVVEKSSQKDEFIHKRLGITRNEFLLYSFGKLLQLVK